jgi:hypothetical protein
VFILPPPRLWGGATAIAGSVHHDV